jgi:hypothetical protein
VSHANQFSPSLRVITYRWLSGGEGVGAMRIPPSPGGATPWVYLGAYQP